MLAWTVFLARKLFRGSTAIFFKLSTTISPTDPKPVEALIHLNQKPWAVEVEEDTIVTLQYSHQRAAYFKSVCMQFVFFDLFFVSIEPVE